MWIPIEISLKLQWNFNRNSNIFIKENTFENVVFEMAAIFARSQCVKLIINSQFHACCLSEDSQWPGHQQPWCRPSSHEIFGFQHQVIELCCCETLIHMIQFLLTVLLININYIWSPIYWPAKLTHSTKSFHVAEIVFLVDSDTSHA